MPTTEKIKELEKRFNSDAAKDVTATYLLTVNGQGGGTWLTKISDGALEIIPQNGNAGEFEPDCRIAVNAEDLDLILDGKMSAMTAALSGVLAIEGELGLAMKLVPIFFEGQVPFI